MNKQHAVAVKHIFTHTRLSENRILTDHQTDLLQKLFEFLSADNIYVYSTDCETKLFCTPKESFFIVSRLSGWPGNSRFTWEAMREFCTLMDDACFHQLCDTLLTVYSKKSSEVPSSTPRRYTCGCLPL